MKKGKGGEYDLKTALWLRKDRIQCEVITDIQA